MRALNLSLLLLLVPLGCAPGLPSPLPPTRDLAHSTYSSPRYASPQGWLCRPDLPLDPCHSDQSSLEIRRDGTRGLVQDKAAFEPPVDCFYVYPTVDLSFVPGNHTDFADREPMTAATLAQAARFNEVCRMYVPLYRQITIATYFIGEQRREPFLETAFSDVADAFLHYLGQHNGKRKIVLIGHSQGADMVVRLLSRFFDNDPAMRERLLVAMAIGGHVEVAKGRKTGGTFANLPICSQPEETGCVIAYRSYLDNRPPSPSDYDAPQPGHETVCVNPANTGSDAPTRFSRMYLPRNRLSGSDYIGNEPPFLLVRDFYSGRCAEGPPGFRYLAVSEAPGPGDLRTSPLPLDVGQFHTRMGLHTLDFQFAQGDLIDLVARKTAAVAHPPTPPR